MGRFHFSKKGSRGGFHANADDEINPAHYGRGPSSDDDHGNRGNAAPAGKSKQQKQKQKKKKKKKFHLFSKSHHSKTAKDEDTPSSSPGNTAYSHAVIDGPIDSDTLQVVEASSSGGERRRDDFHTNPSCGDPSLPAERGVIDVGDDDDDDDDDDFQEYDLGDIPKSISTPTHCDDDDDDDGHFFRPDDHGGDESKTMYSDFESLDSPLSALRKQRARSAALVSANADGGPEKNAAPSTDPSAPVVHSSDLPDLLRIQTALDAPPSLDRLPRYVAALSPVVSPDPSADVPSRALRALFALSEHASRTRERIAMVRYGGGGKARRDDDDYDAGVAPLIPTLLSFLRRCRRDSSEQYLALLVLNNVSIPPENKRPIALTHGGLKTLGRMLCDDPGCHLLVIILVNLTFSDVAVRKDFLCGVGGVGGADGMLVDSLAYALLLSSLTDEQLAALGSIPLASEDGTPHPPRKLLSLLRSALSANRKLDPRAAPLLLDDRPFAETARWCLCAFKNLTRPGTLSPSYHRDDWNATHERIPGGDAIAAQAVWDAGVVSSLLRVIRVERRTGGRRRRGSEEEKEEGGVDRYHGAEEETNTHTHTHTQAHGNINGGNDDGESNVPTWSTNSSQDAALYALLHMASVPGMRRAMREECTCVEELVTIVECGKRRREELTKWVTGNLGGRNEMEVTELGNLSLQCMKARMALSYLIGAEGHFGQPPSKDAVSSPSDDLDFETNYSNYQSANSICEHEAHSIIELLSHCLANRAKEGAGGFSAATFTVKGVLFSIRCVMTDPKNRVVFATIDGARVNALLLKALGRYSLVADRKEEGIGAIMDAEAAEHAVFSLYLMSNYGFQESVCFTSFGKNKFLPENFEGENASVLTSKILSSYLDKDGNTPAGNHAAMQILLRMKYLNFSGPIDELLYPRKDFPSGNDFAFEQKLLSAAKSSYVVNKKVEGAKPKGDVFDRSIIRLRIPADCSPKGVDPKTYSSPLIAVEELSFGSKTVKHSQSIDDIAIANNIAGCAEGFAKQAYGFYWRWEDWGGDDLVDQPFLPSSVGAKSSNANQRKNNSNGKNDASKALSPPRRGLLGMLTQSNNVDEDEPFTIFGFKCGAPMCGR